MTWTYGLLGSVVVRAPGSTITISASRSRTLFVMLVLNPGRTISQASLTEAIWDTEPPASFVANLRTYAHRLRRELGVLGVAVQARNGGYLLDATPDECDHVCFFDLADRGRRSLAKGDAAGAIANLAAAIDLWRGSDVAEGVARNGPLEGLLAAVEEERRRATEDLAEALIRVGEARAALVNLCPLLVAAPLRRRAWQLRMEAHRRLGEFGAISECYRRITEVFWRELDIEPDRELTVLYRAIMCADHRVGVGKAR